MIAYLDLPSGLSGDMLLGCLVDSGWNLARLRHTIESLALPANEWAVDCEQVQKGPLRATLVHVRVEQGRHHRGLDDITRIINGSSLPSVVRERAIAVFNRLANAEAKVHGTTPDRIHFHEVGALDAIIDIVGSVMGLHELGIEKLYASAVPLGHGWVETAHGRLPLPAPATLELLTAVGAPTRPAPGAGELLTPTGAAILAELATFTQPAMALSRIGTGAGTRDFAWPNVARIWLGEAEEARHSGSYVQLETNIDDMNPQLYSSVCEKLFAAGARDVWITPVQMKKGRPGVVLSVLAETGDEKSMVAIMLRETTTLGVRVHEIHHRHEARREIRQLQTPFGTVRAKVKWLGEEVVGIMPEYEDCKSLAEAAKVPVIEVYRAAVGSSFSLSGGVLAGVEGTSPQVSES